MVSGVVIDLNLKEGYSPCLSPLGFLDVYCKYIQKVLKYQIIYKYFFTKFS